MCSCSYTLKVGNWLGQSCGRILTWWALLTRTITRPVEALSMRNSGARAAKGMPGPQVPQVLGTSFTGYLGPHIACLIQVDRWIRRHRALFKRMLLCDNNTSYYNCYLINIYTHFGYLHRFMQIMWAMMHLQLTFVLLPVEGLKCHWNGETALFLREMWKKYTRKICHWISEKISLSNRVVFIKRYFKIWTMLLKPRSHVLSYRHIYWWLYTMKKKPAKRMITWCVSSWDRQWHQVVPWCIIMRRVCQSTAVNTKEKSTHIQHPYSVKLIIHFK